MFPTAKIISYLFTTVAFCGAAAVANVKWEWIQRWRAERKERWQGGDRGQHIEGRVPDPSPPISHFQSIQKIVLLPPPSTCTYNLMALDKLTPWPRIITAPSRLAMLSVFCRLYLHMSFIVPVIHVDPFASKWYWQPCPDSWTLLLPTNPCYNLFGSNNTSSFLPNIFQAELVRPPSSYSHMPEQTANETECRCVGPGAARQRCKNA